MSEENNVEEIKRDQTTHDFVTGLKEREELKMKLHEKERECNTLKGQLYDATKRVEELEKQLAEKNKETKKRRPSSARKPKRPAQRKTDKPKGAKDTSHLSPDTNHKDAGHDSSSEDPEKLYEAIAKKFPEVPLSLVLVAEKKFVEADLDRNGTIDAYELEKLLDAAATTEGTSTMFTKSEVKDILRQIDVDNTESIDFFECVGVLDLLRQNKKTDLPQTLRQNKSAVCSIQ